MGIFLDGYQHLTHHVVPGPQGISYLIPLILLPLALLIPRDSLSRWQSISVFLPVIGACTLHACWQMGGVDVISVDVFLWALLLLALKDPWRDFRYLTINTSDRRPTRRTVQVDTGLPKIGANGALAEQTEPTITQGMPNHRTQPPGEPYPEKLSRRPAWVGRLLISITLTNWIIGSSSHDKAQPRAPGFHSRTAFLRHSLLSFTTGYLTLDLTRSYIEHDEYFTTPGISITSPLPFSSLGFISSQLLRTMIIGAQAWALIGQMFYLPCLLPVGLNVLGLLSNEWSPHTWPPYFGPVSTIFMHGIRGFWGLYWHQTMRWTVSAPGYALADALKLQSGGLARYTVLTVMAFFLSGVVHMGLVPPQPLHATMSVSSIRVCVAGFFWLQPVGMLLEVLVARLLLRHSNTTFRQNGRGRQIRQFVNCVWTIAWFALTLPLLGEMARQLGYWRVWPMPVSLWKGMHGEGWVTWPILTRTG